MKRKYGNGKITVFWDSDKCIHSARCTDGLPAVFDMSRRPWIDITSADAAEIRRVIDSCPSGALTYEEPEVKGEPAVIVVQKSGPYKVKGKCRLLDAEGKEIECGGTFALCRCGASRRMPFCDGSHLRGLLKE